MLGAAIDKEKECRGHDHEYMNATLIIISSAAPFHAAFYQASRRQRIGHGRRSVDVIASAGIDADWAGNENHQRRIDDAHWVPGYWRDCEEVGLLVMLTLI